MAEMTSIEEKVMRAIVAREHKHALAEKREAKKAYTAAHTPAPSKIGWSTKPGPKRKPSRVDQELAKTIAAQRREFAVNHPDVASAQRALRKGRAEMLDRWDHKRRGTPETHEHHAQTREGSLARLYQSGAIDAEQLASAVEIASVAERIRAGVGVKTASLEARVDVTRLGDGTFFEKLGQVRREMAFTRWRAQVQGPVGAVLDMVVGDTVGFTVIAHRYRMGHRRAKKLLIDALDLWPRILGGVRKEVDAATLAAAHAGIL